MKTSKRIKIGWAVICAILAIALCVAVVNEWKSQGVLMPFSMVAGCLFYCAGCVGLFVLGKDAVDWFDYWFGNGDDYMKGRK